MSWIEEQADPNKKALTMSQTGVLLQWWVRSLCLHPISFLPNLHRRQRRFHLRWYWGSIWHLDKLLQLDEEGQQLSLIHI